MDRMEYPEEVVVDEEEAEGKEQGDGDTTERKSSIAR